VTVPLVTVLICLSAVAVIPVASAASAASGGLDVLVATAGGPTGAQVIDAPVDGGASTTLEGVYTPSGMAVDGDGDVFVADSGTTWIGEYPADGAPMIEVDSGHLDYPGGVAVDAHGDLFVTEIYSGDVVEIPAGGGADTTLATGLTHPTAIVVDSSGDVFVGAGSAGIVELPAGGGERTTLGTDGVSPAGLAVDSAGNVFYTDPTGGNVDEMVGGTGAPTTVVSALSEPIGVGVDDAGDLFVAGGFSQEAQVLEVPAGGGDDKVLLSGLPEATSVAVGSAPGPFLPGPPAVTGVVAGDGSATVAFKGSGEEGVSTPSAYTVTASDLSDASAPARTTSGTVSPIAVSGLTNDNAYDFTVSATNSAGTGVPSAVSAAETPFASSLPPDNVFVSDTGNKRVVEAPATGGPLAVIGSGFDEPHGVAVDPDGNVYVADLANGQISEIASGGDAQTTLYSELHPTGIAVDAQGDVFVAQNGSNQVTESLPGQPPQPFGPNGIRAPYSVAVEEWAPLDRGNIFVTDAALIGGNWIPAVEEMSNDDWGFSDFGTGLIDPEGVAVDANGYADIADAGRNDVIEASPFDEPQKVLLSGLDDPSSIAVDPAGNVFVTDAGNDRVIEIPADGGAPTAIASGLNDPTGIAVEPLLLAPITPTVSASDTSAEVSFRLPTPDGGQAPNSYIVAADDVTHSAPAVTGTGTSSPVTVSGLTPGDSYTFSVAARNTEGSGLLSQPSKPVVVGVADLSTQVTGPSSVRKGTTFTETIKISNRGPAIAVSPTITLRIPAGLTLIRATGATRHGQTLTWAYQSLSSSGTVTDKVTFQDTSRSSQTVTITARSASKDHDQDMYNNLGATKVRLG
jgi:sugar lactone lactonase YvrE